MSAIVGCTIRSTLTAPAKRVSSCWHGVLSTNSTIAVTSPHAARFLSTTRLVGRRVPTTPLRAGLPRTIRYVAPPSFNTLLKKFVLQVHPDLFAQHPEQAAVNQQSLQQLNAFVSSLKSKDTTSMYPEAQKLQLVFYLKKRTGDAEYLKHVVLEGKHVLSEHARKKMIQDQRPAEMTFGERILAYAGNAKSSEQSAIAEVPEPALTRGEVLDSEFHILPMRLRTNGQNCRNMVAAQFKSAFIRAGVEGAAADFVWDQDYWKATPADVAAAQAARAAQDQQAQKAETATQ